MFDFYTSSLARSNTNNSRFVLVVYIFRQQLISQNRVAFPTNRVYINLNVFFRSCKNLNFAHN